MKANCEITLMFKDAENAKKILKSIEVDNLDFLEARVDGKKLVATIKSNSVSSLLHTLDDYLACVSVAEKIVDKN